jgi:hypothetical protein
MSENTSECFLVLANVERRGNSYALIESTTIAAASLSVNALQAALQLLIVLIVCLGRRGSPMTRTSGRFKIQRVPLLFTNILSYR